MVRSSEQKHKQYIKQFAYILKQQISDKFSSIFPFFIFFMKQQKDQIWDQPFKQKNSSQTSKEKIDEYFQQTNLKSTEDFLALKKEMLALLPIDIQYQPSNKFIENTVIKITRHTKNFDLVDIQVHLGHFKFTKISIMSIDQVSPTHSLCFNSSGNFGSIFNLSIKGLALAFKCFSKPQKREDNKIQQKNTLKNIIQEYCIMKISSQLGVGPKVYKELGIDIIIYKNCVQFGMEFCSNPTDGKLDLQIFKRHLKQNLARIHCLQIIHSDIKLENICFSHQSQRYVLIDYGFSSIIRESIGFKTRSKFKGSFTHSSDQMSRLFHQQGYRQVDLYFNDYYGLKLVLRDLKYIQSIFSFEQVTETEDLNFASSPQIAQFLHMNLLKYYLFHLKLDTLQKEICYLSDNNFIKLRSFIPSLLSYSKINQIYSIFNSKAQITPTEEGQAAFVKLSYTQNCFHQQQMDSTENIYVLDQVSDKKSIQYYLNSYERKSNELLTLLKNPDEIRDICQQQYIILLSKAIEINSNKFSLPQLDHICQIAIKFKKISFVPSPQNIGQFQYLHVVSKALFKRSLEKQLNGNYYNIFCWTLTNVVVLHILSEDQLVTYFEKMLNLNLDFQTKVSSILKFNTTISFLFLLSAEFIDFQRISFKINRTIDQYTQKLKQYHTKQQVQILSFALSRRISKKSSQISSLENLRKKVNERLFFQIIQWKSYKQFYCYEFNDKQQAIVQNIRHSSEELSYGSYYLCQFYHSTLLIYYTSRYQHKATEKIIKKIKVGLKLRDKHKSMFLDSILALIKLRKKDYACEEIQIFLDNEIVRNNKISSINSQISSQLINILYKYRNQLAKCSQKHQKQIFYILLQTKQKQFNSNYLSGQDKYFFVIDRILYEKKIEHQFYCYFHEKINDQSFITSKDYFELRSHTQKLMISQKQTKSIKILNLQNILIMILLIKQQKYQKALQLSHYLYKANRNNISRQINRKYIMQLIITKVIGTISIQRDPLFKQKKRQIFFQYSDLACQLRCEQNLLNAIGILIDILSLMYKYAVNKILPLVNRISEKLYLINNRNNTQRFIQVIDTVFRIHRHQKWFVQVNLELSEDKQLWRNPYNLILSYNILQLLSQNLYVFHPRKIFKLFKCLKQCNLAVHQAFKQKMIIFHFLLFETESDPKKIKSICKKIVKFNNGGLIRIKSTSLAKIFVDKQSEIRLRWDSRKRKQLWNKFECWNSKLQNNNKISKLELVCSYNTIWRIVEV